MRILRVYIGALLSISSAMRTQVSQIAQRLVDDVEAADLVRHRLHDPRHGKKKKTKGHDRHKHGAKGHAGHAAQVFPLVSMQDILRHDRDLGEAELFISSFPEWIDSASQESSETMSVIKNLVHDLPIDSLIGTTSALYDTRPSAKEHALGTSAQDLQHLESLRAKVMKAMSEQHNKMFAAVQFLHRSRYALDPGSAKTLEVDLDFVRKQAILQMSVLDESVDKNMNVYQEAAHRATEIYKMLIATVHTSNVLKTADRRTRSKLSLASQVVRGFRKTMNTIRLSALMRPMALQAALTRTLRLLTVGARSSADDAGWELHLNESSISVNYTIEEDYDFLHEFLSSYPVRGSFWNQKAVHARMLAASKPVVDTLHLMVPQFDTNLQGVLVSDASIQKNLASVRTALQSAGAFGFPVLLGHVDSEEDQDKTEWARRWAWIRATAEFSVWPVSVESQAVVAPKICEAPFYIGDDLARFPDWAPGMGGQPIMHSFMVFAGGNLPVREGCVNVLQELLEKFPLSHDRLEHEYNEIHNKAARLGCLGFQRVSKTISEMQEHLSEAFSDVREVMFDIEQASGTRSVSVRLTRSETTRGTVRRKRKLSEGIVDEILRYIMHGMMKYATKIGDDNIMTPLKNSLATSPPKVSAMTLSEHHWEELEGQDVASPYQASRCHEVDGYIECDPWNHTVPGFWSEAKIAGGTLAVVLAAVDAAILASKPGDWARLAQGPALYGAVGFDSPGVIDNSYWECETKTHSCRVHPTCGRIAAQMLEYPFMGDKGYASGWTDKVKVYTETQESGFFSWFHDHKFHSDGSGFHDWCHRPGKAYCWSYTMCLQKMMNFLCSDPWTSQYCCPTPDIREACQIDVNGEGCKVCQETSGQDEDDWFPPQPFEDEEETMNVLHMDDKCKLCVLFADKYDGKEWMFVKDEAMCKGEELVRCAELCGFKSTNLADFSVCRLAKDECEGCLL